ncbi:MAG: 3-hydroxyacyl-CoA dehydrogenase/enoyl-CoA hydratase family protein [Chitinophagales bacterium]|nr:3-hydroxyacyl-CoA dehydrogenase/enoyl-CoA hydratase family protein [Chitinophagaceae bacterium]MBP9882789.1 3-hydroxyacyl-CoA dehydrogenase/enoyl-CoA hydratase family protein [Chitinophagales bacterium]
MNQRKIRKVAILGSGVMGSRIACHFANIGVQVLLLDMVPNELTAEEKSKGLSTEHTAVRNRIVNNALQATLKSKPAAVYASAASKLITTGNFTDHLKDIAGCDWVMEVVVENLDIKKKIYDQVEKFRAPGTLVSSNTSSIPIHLMAEGRSADFQKHFCGTHFFNPPRYLRLLEIIPTPATDPEVISFLMDYGDLFLGKATVLCKDTPAFIANRIGVYAIMQIFHLMEKLNMTVQEIDSLTGPAIGRPKSATFRTSDVVGLDTLVKVAQFVHEACPADEARSLFLIPAWLEQMVKNNWLGDKTGQGFFKKEKRDGKTVYPSLDIRTMEYGVPAKTKFATIDQLKQTDNLKQKMKIAVNGKDKAGDFYRQFFYGLLQYVSNRIPEIADDIYRVDDALNAGFGWELGPFATWDAMGLSETVQAMEKNGQRAAKWVYEMLEKGHTSFYKVEDGKRKYYDISSSSYKNIPGSDAFIILENHSNNIVWKNSGTHLIDIGDGVLNLEFKTKMNTIGGEVLDAIPKSIELAEKNFAGLVIGNQGENFSAGANLAMMLMLAIEQEYDELSMACKMFQNASMRIRYSSIPVVVAPHHLTLGGGCEFCLHADRVQAAAETYIGLVEFGVGIIPAGAGSKEMALRASNAYQEGEIEFPELQKRFLNIATAKVATSAAEAFEMDIFRKGIDDISINEKRLISDAKQKVLEMAGAGYTMPAPRNDIYVLGRSALSAFYAGIVAMQYGNYASEHDRLIAEKLAYVMCGGDLTAPAYVSEQYLLDLEREAFLSLATTKKSMERMQSILNSGKVLRN